MEKQKGTFEITIKNTTDARAMPFAIRINALSINIFVMFIWAIFGFGTLAAVKYSDSQHDAELLAASLNQQQNALEVKEQKISLLSTDISLLESDLVFVEAKVGDYKNKIIGLEDENDDLTVKMSYSYQNILDRQISELESRIIVLSGIKFASESINNGVMLLDWFDGGSEAFVKRAPVKVIDVQTGLSFEVERFGGKYHADSQPLTKNDTLIMKIIVGEWTWDRRAIWVKIENVYYAASMNAMPHMVSPNKTNGFNGHFCIHFLGSLVHETGEVCDRHQAMVMEAFLSADILKK